MEKETIPPATLESINPATGQRMAVYPFMPLQEIETNIHQAHCAFLSWRHTDLPLRSQLLIRVGKILRDRADRYSRLITAEMGKPLAQSRSEIDKCALACDHFAEHAKEFLSPQMIPTEAAKSYVAFRPLGVILAVMPWNFPFWQVFRFLAPALMAGNACVLKHSSTVTGCALAIEEILNDASGNSGIFRTLLTGSQTMPFIIKHPLIQAVTLTGGTSAGRAVASLAGAQLKKTILELGGSDPYLILKDADLEKTVNACVTAKLINSGQSCIAPKRFIVVDSIKAEFEALFVSRMNERKMGDPLAAGTDIGPLARVDLRDALHQQVEKCVTLGAKRLCGGKIPGGPGAFYPATVLSDVKKGMPAYDEELFGPVAAIIPVKDEAEAILVANDNPYGLGGAVFSKDAHHAEAIARDAIETGSCFVNTFVRSDPRLPFGGIKNSGYGRELSSFGLHEFVNIKTIYVA